LSSYEIILCLVGLELCLRDSSWWEDWVSWAKAHGGQRRKPPPMGSDRYPPIADAPGSYIHEK
jgi:polyhydroxyalkanoate synthase